MMRLDLPPLLDRIVRELHAAGHRPMVVGGAVRDALLGGEPKDFDIEVYGISYERLAEILARHGRVDLVGKSFGVVKLNVGGREYDFSVPRRDNKLGLKHRDFQTTFDENITPREAASRRDFTVNAMAYDPVKQELLDFFGGAQDLKNRVLRATSDAFAEDPLRVLRGMQFACRFDLTLDPETAAMCKSISDHYGTIARERVADEFMKWALKSSHPGRIGEYLAVSGWNVHFPEIARLAGVPQDPGWHPEGDVGTHTMLVLDAAARIAEREKLEDDDRAVLLFSALSHDFAKATTTALRERDGKMRWTSWGHEAEGGPMARAFLDRIGIKSAITDRVVPLVENHLVSSHIGREATPRAVRRLAMRLEPATITDLLRLIEADHSGRPPLPVGLPEGAVRIREMAQAQAVERGPQAPLILGRHVMPYFDDQPGKHIGEVTAAAYEAQADGAFSNQEEAIEWLERYMTERAAQR
ncbi:MAG: cca [Bryobacterales bacterium]|nr:cca [Bryobacterales bacterium]